MSVLGASVACFSSGYKDISLIDSGAALGGNASAITFSPALAQNDVVFLSIVNREPKTWTLPAGYTQVATAQFDGTLYRWTYAWKAMGASPDSGINLQDSNADGSGFTFYALRNVNTSDPFATASTTSATNDPPSITVPNQCWVIASTFGSRNASAAFTAAPSGYSGFLTVDVTAGTDCAPATAYKVLTNSATEDPGTFSESGGAWSGYFSITHAIQPALA